MGSVIYPANSVGGVPSYTGDGLRAVDSIFIGGGSSSRPFGGTSGVGPRTPVTTVTATSTTWTVGAHAGYIDAESSPEAGGYRYAVTSSGGLPTGNMNAADPTYSRIDLISMQVSDPAESDGSTLPGVSPVYTPGAPAATPVAPPPPPRSLLLAQITVPKAGAGSPSVVWVAPYLGAAIAQNVPRTLRASASETAVNVGSSTTSAISKSVTVSVDGPRNRTLTIDGTWHVSWSGQLFSALILYVYIDGVGYEASRRTQRYISDGDDTQPFQTRISVAPGNHTVQIYGLNFLSGTVAFHVLEFAVTDSGDSTVLNFP